MSPTNDDGATEYPNAKHEPLPLPDNTVKFNSVRFTVLNVRTEIIILLEENLRENISDLGLSKDFLDRTLKVLNHRRKKINKFHLIKIKIFCSSKDTLREIKDQAKN